MIDGPPAEDTRDSIRQRFLSGRTFAELLAKPRDNAELWSAIYKRAELTADASARAAALTGEWNMLILTEDWCSDSVNILPYLARLEECCHNIAMRAIGRDDNPDLMDAHLTGKSRSIPVAIVYDGEFNEHGWWGPRPAPIQQWVIREGLALPKPERYRHIRAWYARDRGHTVVSEILTIMERLNA